MSPFLEHLDPSRSTVLGSRNPSVQHEGQTSNGIAERDPSAPAAQDIHDLLCVGFGPASLAIAIAYSDAMKTRKSSRWSMAGVGFLEKQPEFAWHAGMLLPGSKMQISFIKDLATLRDPCSQFTFLKYLKEHGRLVQFSNLGTFLPSRAEFADYMRWCADHFDGVVGYGQEVMEILPEQASGPSSPVDYFAVRGRSIVDGSFFTRRARNVVIAIGGVPHVPAPFSRDEARLLHSSRYCGQVASLLPDTSKAYQIAVIGGGQSAAEIFHDLSKRYPNAKATLIIRDSALRPSDDSPFVNEIFDPDRVDGIYHAPAEARAISIKADRATNYGVVRLELLEQIYHDLYQQKVKQADETKWQHRILCSREISHVSSGVDENGGKLKLTITDMDPLRWRGRTQQETLEVDAVILATGYVRDVHEKLLKGVEHLRPRADQHWRVRRDYKVEMERSSVSPGAGIWLQGCNESTHGLSDTLLSILATRGGELVESIFGPSSTER